MIETESSSISYSGNASTTTAYSVPFPFLDTSHVVVIVTDADGVSTTLTAGTDYTLNGTYSTDAGRYTSGSLTTVTAYASTYTVAIKRVTPVLQPTELTEAGPFPAETLETALDRMAMIEQETRRDSSPADSDIEVSGTGIVAQTTEGTFAARTISPASNSGLTVTNGDGVSGNPTIDTDFSTLPVVTSLAESDIIVTRASGVESGITAANLRSDLATGSYGTVTFNPAIIVPDQTDACTIETADNSTASDKVATFSNSADAKGYFRFNIPGDYSGGELKMRLNLTSASASNIGGNAVLQVRAAAATDGGSFDISGSYEVTVEGLNYDAVHALSNTISLGSGYTAGASLLVEIFRDVSHASDSHAAGARILGIQIQYPRQSVTTAWS